MIIKDKQQTLVQLIGFTGILFGIRAMLKVHTIILPPWFLLLLFLSITLGTSFLLSLTIKRFLKSNWSKLTFTVLITGIFCFTFYISQYQPTHRIDVPNSFSGEVLLFVSKEAKDRLELNKYGIGYISQSTFQNGFNLEVEKGGEDITAQIMSLSYGSMIQAAPDGKMIGPYKYVSFSVPGKSSDSLVRNLPALIEGNAIDTSRLSKQ